MKKIISSQKKIIFIILGLLLVISLAVLTLYLVNQKLKHPVDVSIKKPVLEFMTDTEKEKLGLSLSPEVNPTRIQILKRDAKSNVVEYKLINSDSDIITPSFIR